MNLPGLKSGRFLSLLLLFVCGSLVGSSTTSATTTANASTDTSTVSVTSAPASTPAYTTTTPASTSTITVAYTTTTPDSTSITTATDITTTIVSTSTTTATDTTTTPASTSTTTATDTTTTPASTSITTATDTTTTIVSTSTTTAMDTTTTPASTSITTATDTTTTPASTSTTTALDTTTNPASISTTTATDTTTTPASTSTTIAPDITTTPASTSITTATDTTTTIASTSIMTATDTTTTPASTPTTTDVATTTNPLITTTTTYALTTIILTPTSTTTAAATTTSDDITTSAANETMKTPTTSQHKLTLSYDCRRLSDCRNNGTCNLDSGNCTCQSGFTEYNCAFENKSISPSCNNSCQNEGVCYNDGDCACRFGYYGNNCTNTTVNIECGADTIKVRVSLGEKFVGKIYVLQNASCTLNGTGTTGNMSHYELEMTINGTDCYINRSEKNDGEITQLVQLFVQYDKDTYTPVDEVYDMSCVISGSNVNVSSVAVEVRKPDARKNFTRQYVIQTVKGVTFKMMKDGNLLEEGTVYNVADPFDMSVQLTEVEAYRYSSVKFQWCTVGNNDPSVVGKSFLDNGCTTNFGKSFVTHEQIQGNGTATNGKTLGNSTVSMKLIKFVNSTQVKFTCMVTKCSQSTQCELNCGSSGRKKRAAVPYSDDFEISTVLTVSDPPQDTGSGTNKSDVSSKITKTFLDCLQMGEMMAMLSSMMALICILGTSCIFTTCFMSKRGKKIVHLEQKIENFEHKHSYFTMFH